MLLTAHELIATPSEQNYSTRTACFTTAWRVWLESALEHTTERQLAAHRLVVTLSTYKYIYDLCTDTLLDIIHRMEIQTCINSYKHRISTQQSIGSEVQPSLSSLSYISSIMELSSGFRVSCQAEICVLHQTNDKSTRLQYSSHHLSTLVIPHQQQ